MNNGRTVLVRIFAVVVLCYLLQIAIHPDLFFQPSSYLIEADWQRSFNVNYFMASSFARFHLPLANTYRHLGEPMGFYHIWLGVYTFQNLLYGLLIRFIGLFTAYNLSFKYGYLSFNFIFNLFILLSGYYLLLRKVTKNMFTVTICFIYISLFGFYQLYAFDTERLNLSVLSPFFFLCLLDFFCYRANRRNFVLMMILGGLLFFYGPSESSRFFYPAFFLLIGIVVSYLLKAIDSGMVKYFFRNPRNYPAVLLSAAVAAVVIFPVLYAVRNEIPKFSLARTTLGLQGINFRISNFSYLNLAIPVFWHNYVGLSWVLLVIVGAIWGKSKLKPLFLTYLLLTLIVAIHNNASNLLVNIGYLAVYNSRIQRWFESYMDYFPVLYVFIIALAVDTLVDNKNNLKQSIITKTFKKPAGWFWLVILVSSIVFAFLNFQKQDTGVDIQVSDFTRSWLYFYFLLFIAYYLLLRPPGLSNLKTAKMALVLVVFLELCFLASSRLQFHEKTIGEAPHIHNLAITFSPDFDNRLYDVLVGDNRENYSNTGSLLDSRFYLPFGSDRMPYYNFKTIRSERLYRSGYYQEYISSFNKKFNFLSLEQLNRYEQFINAGHLYYGMIPVLKNIYRYNPGIKMEAEQQFTVTKFLPDYFRIQTNFSEPVLVLFNQVYDPAWALEIDGLEHPVVSLDGYLMRFEIPEGFREIRLWYRNRVLRGSIYFNYLVTFILLFYIYYYYFFSGKYPDYPVSGERASREPE